MITAFFNMTFLGNTPVEYLKFIIILSVGLFSKNFISTLICWLLFTFFKRDGRSVGVQRFVHLLRSPVRLFVLVLIVYAAFIQLTFPVEWHLAGIEVFGLRLVLFNFFKAMMVIASFWIVLRLIDFTGLVLLEKAKESDSPTNSQLVPFLKEAVKVIIAGIGFLVLLGVAFELDVVSLLTGLGIGGLAFALAAKETLENLLGSFTIFLDKPFVVGDFVKVGPIEGKVESIGFRSTRIRSTDRTLVTVPNKKLVDAELINETNRTVRRSLSSLILSFDTNSEKLEKALSEIRIFLLAAPLVEKQSVMVNLKSFKQEGFEVQVIYIVETADLPEFLNHQEKNALEIIKIIENNEIAFAEADRFKKENAK